MIIKGLHKPLGDIEAITLRNAFKSTFLDSIKIVFFLADEKDQFFKPLRFSVKTRSLAALLLRFCCSGHIFSKVC